MASNFKIKPLNMALQAGKIKALFPESILFYNHDRLTWRYTITPSPLSREYDIKLIYVKGKDPNVYVITKLDLYPGETKLQHVYSTKKQWLCLYYRKGREWKSNMLISDTVIPWTCEWLLHYECWLGTGKWHGGGIHVLNLLNNKTYDQNN
jgi:hypothetical protein